MAERQKIWVLYALPDEDSTVLEAFEEDEGPPTDEYIKEMFGGGFLFEYDLDGTTAINGRPCAPKGFDV